MPTIPDNSTCIRSRSDTTANWTAANPILLQGEWAHDVTTGCVRIGDGVTHWLDLCEFCPECDSPPPPPPPTGACCFGKSCVSNMTQAACVQAGGTWKGANVPCSPNPCPEDPPRPKGSGSGSQSGLVSCDGYCWTDFYCRNQDGTERLFSSSGAGYRSYSECVAVWKATKDACVPVNNIGTPPCNNECNIKMRYEVADGCALCGLNASFSGERGVHEFLIDLKDKSGTLGVWFNTEDKPDRFSLHWPLTATNQPQSSLPEYTSGWRGKKTMAASITGLSANSPYLRYPKSHGPVFYNGSYNNGPQAMIGQEVLGPIRANETWGYFLFMRTAQQAAAGQARYARLVVEAPLEETKWYCGIICDVPPNSPICWQEAGPVTRYNASGAVVKSFVSGCTVGTIHPMGAIGDAGNTEYRGNDGPVTVPDTASAAAYQLGAHDWKAEITLALNEDANFGTLSTAMPNDVVEALYHPKTGFWINTQLRLCASSADNGPALGSAGCTASGWANGEPVGAIDPNGSTYGLVNAAAGTAQGGQEPPRGPGGVG